MSFCSDLAQRVINARIGNKDTAKHIIDYISTNGCLPDPLGISDDSYKKIHPVLNATALNVTPEAHLLIQSALQCWVDSSISKTINCRKETTIDDVGKIYLAAWKMRLKGVAIYRTGSREHEVLISTGATSSGSGNATMVAPAPSAQAPVESQLPIKISPSKKQRPPLMPGCTHRCETSFGRVFTTVNFDTSGPLEVFITLGKSGTEAQADCEAIGRLASFILRVNSQVSQHDRMDIVIAQLRDIGGSRTFRDSSSKRTIRSVPDAVSVSLEEIMTNYGGMPDTHNEVSVRAKTPMPVARDICPQCHKMTLIRAERCAHCEECPYSLC
jgi:ribonucleoside-diphosphate reductase alpha chain